MTLRSSSNCWYPNQEKRVKPLLYLIWCVFLYYAIWVQMFNAFENVIWSGTFLYTHVIDVPAWSNEKMMPSLFSDVVIYLPKSAIFTGYKCLTIQSFWLYMSKPSSVITSKVFWSFIVFLFCEKRRLSRALYRVLLVYVKGQDFRV